MSWRVSGKYKGSDPDAYAYIAAVEQQDNQALENGVKFAISNFVVGCKDDGIWDAIKASCILAGARTLAGALVPLTGDAPTNFNFVSDDYDRKTGLVGDGATKYLDSNRSSANETLNNAHLSSFISTRADVESGYIGLYIFGSTSTVSLIGLGSDLASRFYLQDTSQGILAVHQNSTLLGVSRSEAGQKSAIVNNQITTLGSTSTGTTPLNYFIFAYNDNGSPSFYTNARLAFYSIGESLDLALLDTRTTRLTAEMQFAINTGLNPSSYNIDTINYVNAGYAAGGTLA